MATKRETQVPGQTATPVADESQASTEPEMVSVKAVDLQKLVAKVESLQAQVAARGAARPAADADLPDQSDVDPDAIERSVLTRQGWVVPTRKGAPPAGAKV